MQESLFSQISILIASISVTLGVVYYILNRLRAQKREELDMVMRIYMEHNTKEFHENYSLVVSAEFKDIDEFVKKFGSPMGREPIPIAFRQIIGAYNQLGLLLYHKHLKIQMVQSLFEVERHWEKVRPIVEAARKSLNDPSYLMYFEYLYDELKAFKEKK